MSPNVPKYIQIIERIKQDFIFNPDYTDKHIPSIRKLCVEYDASLLTVNKSIMELKERGYLYGEQGRGVFIQSRENATDASHEVKQLVVFSRVISGAVTQKYEFDILNGLQDLCNKNRCPLTHIQLKRNQSAAERLHTDKLLEKEGVGFVFLFEDEAILSSVAILDREGLPYVAVANDHVPADSRVMFDLTTGINAALRDLKKQGYSNFHYIGRDLETRPFVERREVFRRFLKRHYPKDSDQRVHLLSGDVGSRRGYDYMKTFLKDHPDADALFFAEDRTALGALIYMKENGLDSPNPIAVFGVGNTRAINEQFIPSISSIDYAGEEIGRRVYLQLVDGRKQESVKGTYVKRESTTR